MALREYTVTAQIAELGGEEPQDREAITELYLDGFTCIVTFSSGGTSPSGDNGCTVEKESDPNTSPIVFTVTFDNLKFTKPGVETNMVLTFSSPYGHQFDNAATSKLIGVETAPISLRFEQSPPTSIGVMEIFQVKVAPEIRGGGALAAAVVKCNVTQSVNQDSLSDQMFSNLATSSLSLEKSNSLASSVVIDDTRTTQISGSDGIANFYLKILRGLHAKEVSLICECQGIKSPLSPVITLQNDARQIKLINDFSEEIKVEYEETDVEVYEGVGYLSNDVVFQVIDKYSRPVEGIDIDEISISILTEAEATALEN